jgi:NADH-quinone oxidoreductase subunit H
MLNVSAVAVTLFLGGWRAPVPDGFLGGALNEGWLPILWFLVKLWAVMFVFVWVRGTLLRLRYDQFMVFGWKVLIPVALGWVVVLSVVQWLQRVQGVTFQQFIPVIVGAAVVFIAIMWFWPEKKESPPGAGEEKEPVDAFAGGFPVPPLPGEKLPPSKRFGKEVHGE